MSDIRKIQTGNNQYTLHARVSDKLASVATYITRNQINYPWHRIATSGTLTEKNYDDFNVVLCITEHGDPDGFGIIKINLRKNNSNVSIAKATWLLRFKFNIDDIQLGLRNTAGDTCLDVFIKLKSLWQGGVVYKINEGNRNVERDLYKFITSEEAHNTTATNKLTSVEVYKTIEEAATQLHGKAYTSIIKPTDSGTVANAGYAEKIGTNKSHPQIGSPTKPVYVDSSGEVRACSRDIPTGMAIDTVLNDTSVNAVQNKVINAALKGKNPKAKADFIASSDLTALPITAGVLDLNGYTLTLSGTTELTGTLTIKNGTIGGNGTLQSFKEGDENSVLNFIYINDCKLINQMQLNLYTYVAILDNVHNTAINLQQDEVTYANITFFLVGYITNFSDISIKCTNPVIPDQIDLINGHRIKIENANVLIRSSSTIDFYGYIQAKMFSCSSVNLDVYGWSIHNPDQQSTFEFYSCFVKGKSDEHYYHCGRKYYNTENSYWEEVEIFDNLVQSDDITTVCRYKGTVASYYELPDIDEYSKYDIYTITNANATHNIKAGDSVISDGKKWINLSGDLSNYLQKGGKQTTTSTADGGNNVYTFTDGSTITVKNGSKGSTGAAATWFSGGAVTGTSTTAKTFTVSGSKAGDMYLNTGTSNVYKATAANQWVYLCNIKGPQGTPGNNGTTPTINAAAGGNINSVGTPSVTANTSGTTTTFTFNNLKGQKGDTGATVTWHTGTAVTGTAATVAGAKTGDMYLNTKTYNVYKSTGTNKWVGVCNIKGAKGDAADIPKLAKGVAGIVPGTTDDNLNAFRWLNGGDNGTGKWSPLPIAGGDTSGIVRTCKDYTGSINKDDIDGYAHGTTPPTLQPITSGASDYRGVESDGSGRLFVNVPAYEKNINRAQNTVLAAPTTGTGTATFRKLTTSDIPWGDKLKVVTESQFNSTTPTAGVFYFVLEE